MPPIAHTPAAAPAPPTKGKSLYIPSLDGIRAVSFMLVFLAHAGLERRIPGGLGVTVFFFLSGYLITTLLRTEMDQSGRISIRDFYLRRVLRIFPPFYLTILLAVLLHVTHVLPGRLDPRAVLWQCAHLANYWGIYHTLDGIPAGTNVLWSLAVEEHFYLVFPLLYVILRRRASVRWQTIWLGAICAAMLAWRCVLVYHFHVLEKRTFSGTDTRADSILFGCIFAIAWNPVLDEIKLRDWRMILLAACGLALLAATIIYRNFQFRESFRYSLQGLSMIPIFAAAIIYWQSPLFRWLNFRWVRHLGVLSYSLYLVHFTVIFVVNEHVKARPLLNGVLALALSFAVSSAFYRWVERPFAALRIRYSHASRPPGPHAPAPPKDGDSVATLGTAPEVGQYRSAG
jgi:peptidoglycan/LPS O-acetylase OafA/YrhL